MDGSVKSSGLVPLKQVLDEALKEIGITAKEFFGMADNRGDIEKGNFTFVTQQMMDILLRRAKEADDQRNVDGATTG